MQHLAYLARVKESFSEMMTSKDKYKRQVEVSLMKEYGRKVFFLIVITA